MTYTKLLVPLEGSRLSEGALPYARWLARSGSEAARKARRETRGTMI